MSDDDLDSELLGLIDEPSKRASSSGSGQKQRSGSSSKRRKAADTDDSASDDGEPEIESEEDDDGVVRHASSRAGASSAESYPLEGKFKDEKDKARIMVLSEVEREVILAERLAEKQKDVERQALDALYATQRGNVGAAATEGVAGAAKRKHTTTGASSEKKKKLEELTKKRSEKSKKAGTKKRSVSPGRSIPSSGESSDEDEMQRRDIASTLQAERDAEEAENISLADVQGATLRRAHLLTMLSSPHFEEFVTGSYVRIAAPPLPGKTQGGYLVCEVLGISTVPKPYSVDPDAPHIKDNRRLTLKHGAMEKGQQMNLISSGSITQDEMTLWIKALVKAGLTLPRKSELAKQRVKWAEIKRRAVTDADITANLRRKKELGLARSQYQDQQIALNRRRGEYNMALKRQDWDAADHLAKSITDLEEQLEMSRPASGLQTPSTAEDSKASGSTLGAAGGDAIWRMKERNKEVLRQALEAAKKEAAVGASDKQRKKAKLEATGSSQQVLSEQPTDSQDVDMDNVNLPPDCSAARGIPLPAWKTDRFGFGQVTSKLVLDLGPGF